MNRQRRLLWCGMTLGARISRLETLVLASGLLLLVPGVRVVWAWPWLWLVPGWFFARRVLAVQSGMLLVMLSLASSIAFGTLVCLPLTIAFGGPRPWIIVGSVIAFALACTLVRRREEPRALPTVPWPPLAAIGLAAAFVAFRVVVAVQEAARTPAGPDGWYLAGVVRELATSYPPSNPIAATTLLKQPWGYWMLYALSHVASGVSVPATLQIASTLLAIAFLAAVYVVVTVVSGDRRAGGFSMALALGAGELLWLEEIVRPNTERLTWQTQGITSFAANLVDAFYDVPVLLLAITVLYFLVSERVLIAGVFAAIAPFFHPVHASVLFIALGLALGFEALRRRLGLRYVWLFAVPVPFFLLYSVVYAHGLPTHSPFVPNLAGVGAQLVRTLRLTGLFVPFAIAGALRPRVRGRSFFVALLVTTLALSIFTSAVNYHWTTDLLSVATILLGGIGLADLATRGRLGSVLAIAIAVTSIATADYPSHIASPIDRRADDERAAGRWLREHTSSRAIVAVDHDAMPAVATALGIGERRLFLGPIYQFVNTATRSEVDALVATNRAVLRDPCEAHMRAIDFVLLDQRKTSEAWRTMAPAYENPNLVIYAPSCSPTAVSFKK